MCSRSGKAAKELISWKWSTIVVNSVEKGAKEDGGRVVNGNTVQLDRRKNF